MRWRAIATTFLGLSTGLAFCDSAPDLNSGPVEAELLAHINVHHLEGGKAVFARVTRDWKGQGCSLRTGAILEGTVETAEPRKGRSESRLALSFRRAQCDGPDLKPMELLLAAVAQAPADWENVPDAEFKMPVMFMQPNGMNGFGGAGIGGFSLSHMELRGIIHRFPMSRKVQPGDVLDIKGMKLELGTGPNRSSVLSTKNRDLTLDAFTQLLLVPSALVFVPASQPLLAADREENARQDSRAAAPSAVPVNDLEVCEPPGCSVDLPANGGDAQAQGPTSIAIDPLGYKPRARRMLGDFVDEEALVWLGPHELLFTFNPHGLIRRVGTQEIHRVIRAMLLDTQSHSVTRAVDWEIADAGRYLWPLDNRRVLVHVGDELRVCTEGLEVERSIRLQGPLAFVRIAPNGTLMAVATLRERHSPELHAKMREELGSEPEEDVDVSIIDGGLNTIAHASTVSGLRPPTLLDEGQVNLLTQPRMRYRLALTTWDNQEVTLARVASRCAPELSSIAPDLLFLLSCNVATGRTEYRVLGANGKLLMRGEADPFEVGQDVAGNAGKAMFAMKAVRAVHELASGIEFKATDLESEELRVYRAADGKRLLVAHVDQPITSHGGFALSPDGSQLAVLSRSQIQFFPVPAE